MINACQCFCWSLILLQEEGPLAGLLSEFLPNTQKWITWGDTRDDKARDFTGKGHPGGEQQGEGTQEDCCAAWLPGVYAPRLSLANHSVPGVPGDSCVTWPRWIPGRVLGGGRAPGAPFDFSWTLPLGGGLLVPCSFPGPPVGKWLRPTVTVVPASWAVSVFPLKTPRSTQVVPVITMCNSPVKVHST